MQCTLFLNMDPFKLIGPPKAKQFDSNQYIATLEYRLNKIKGHNKVKEPSAKDVLDSLTIAKTDAMSILTKSSNDPYISDHSNIEDTPVYNSSLACTLQRKLQPNKQALTREELSQLLENDELSKMSVELQAQEENESNMEVDLDKRQHEADAHDSGS